MKISLLPGTDKLGNKETFTQLDMNTGEIYAICGNTGAGKSRLIKDIEMLVNKDSVTKRTVLLDGIIPTDRMSVSESIIAHLGQNMRFVLDISVAEFIKMHSECRKRSIDPQLVIDMANSITTETILPSDNLTLLSGGQSRAIMIADIALICDSPLVLIDEIENAGIDKTAALNFLIAENKLVLIVTHDPHTMLMAKKRLILKCGAITSVVERSKQEEKLLEKLTEEYQAMHSLRKKLRNGERL